MSGDVMRYERELAADPALVERVLSQPDIFPPVPEEAGSVIRCSRENADRAVARAIANAVVLCEAWRVEMAE